MLSPAASAAPSKSKPCPSKMATTCSCPSFTMEWHSSLPPTSAYHDGHFYGHGEITVFNRTHMLWSWVPNPAQAGELPYDTYWIAPRGPAYGSRKEQVIAVPFAGAALAGAVLLLAACCCCCCCAGRCAALCRRRARQGTEREGLLGEG